MKLASCPLFLLVCPLLLPTCQGVRKQAGRMVPEAPNSLRVQTVSKSVSMAPGADGQMHSFTRETQSTQMGEGSGAQVATVIRECTDGECKERSQTAIGEEAQRMMPGRDWVSEFFNDDSSDILLRGPLPKLRFGLDEFEDIDGFGGLTSWIDGDPFGASSIEMPSVDSVTRTEQITVNGDGEERRKEIVTRCHNGKCTTEVVREEGSRALEGKQASPDDGKATSQVNMGEGISEKALRREPYSDTKGDVPKTGEAPAVHRATTTWRDYAKLLDDKAAQRLQEHQEHRRIHDAGRKGNVPKTGKAPAVHGATTTWRDYAKLLDDKAAQRREERQEHRRIKSDMPETGHTAAAVLHDAKERATYSVSGDAPAGAPEPRPDTAMTASDDEVGRPSRSSEVVNRRIVVQERNGHREEFETIERCRDGKCTREIRRVMPDGKETSSIQEYRA